MMRISRQNARALFRTRTGDPFLTMDVGAWNA
jgi:hypothetical protein